MSEFYNTHLPASAGGLQEQLQWHTRSAMQRLTAVWVAHGADVLAERSSRLRTQYRMHDSICEVVDTQFYRRGQVLLPSERATLSDAVQLLCPC